MVPNILLNVWPLLLAVSILASEIAFGRMQTTHTGALGLATFDPCYLRFAFLNECGAVNMFIGRLALIFNEQMCTA